MTRARTGSHSRTEPGAVHAYEVVDHGIDNASYFGGCGIAHTDWDDVAVGVGNSPLEAYEDAVEALAQAGWEVDALPAKPRGLSSESELQNVVDYDDGDELQHYVCVYVRGIPTRRTRMAQQRRAGTVGPGRPGQQFTHGDVEIETTLHPIDLDGVSPRTRRGTRVRFEPNAASHLLYSERYGLPERGEEGTVTYMPGFKPKTYMQGPGGGLLYVEWDQAGVLGVSPYDVEKVG